MPGRRIPGLASTLDISRLFADAASARRRRRAALAFATGTALFAGVAAALLPAGALAHGPAGAFVATVFSGFVLSDPPPRETVEAAPTRHRHVRSLSPSGQSVCVRLCDGYFFPAPASQGGTSADAACSSLCPDAPMAAYSIPAGSDRIEDAISREGKRYSALPVALRYRSTADNTCACRRYSPANLDPLADPTLRQGDTVMTGKGFLVFQGAQHVTHPRSDFTLLAAAKMSKERRTELQTLERVSVLPQRGATRSWFAQDLKPTPAATVVAIARYETKDAARAANANDKIHFVERTIAASN